MKAILRYGALFVAVLVASGSSAKAENITILAGPVGGGWYLIGAGMAKIIHNSYPEIDVKVVPGGATANPPRVSEGSADFALALTAPTIMAYRGQEMFKKKYDKFGVVAFGFSKTYLQFIAKESYGFNDIDSAIKSENSLRLGAPSNTTLGAWAINKLLEINGTSQEKIRKSGGSYYQVSHNQQQDLMQNGQVDVLGTLLAIPSTDIVVVSSTSKIKFLTMSDKSMDALAEYGFARETIEPKTYPGLLKQPLPAVSMASGLIASNSVKADLVYKVTKALYSHAAEVAKIHPSMSDFMPADVAKPSMRGHGALPIHPGAAKYFDEAGIAYK